MATERPRLRDILAGDEWMKVGAHAGMSVAEIARILAPVSGMSAGLFQATLEAGDSLGRRLGFKSTKRIEKAYAAPYATVVRALVLSVASQRHAITTMLDTPKGVFIEAELPKDFRSLGGALRFDVVEEGPGRIQVAGESEIKGQMFDWGKGKQALNDVLAKTDMLASRLAA